LTAPVTATPKVFVKVRTMMDMIQRCCTNTAADCFQFLLTGIVFWITSDPQNLCG